MNDTVKNQKQKKRYHLRIPSQTDNLEIIREFVTRIARQVGFRDEDIGKIELAVDEACTNVIEHAYGYNDKKPIQVDILFDQQKLSVTISDRGKGFDPKKLKPPDMKKYMEDMRRGGLGVHLMQRLMDEIDFDIKPGKKNMVRMVKYLNGDKPGR